MDPARYAEVKRVFREAIRWAPEDRAEVVGALAEGNAAVQGEVLSLLAHHRDAAAPGEPGGGGARVERARAEDGGGGVTLAERMRLARAGGVGTGWPLERVLRVLDPVARRLAEVADSGGIHGAVRADRVVLAGDDKEAAELVEASVRSQDGADSAAAADAEPAIDRAMAASAAPEQLLRSLGPTGPWTDVYGLALLCVELMLGRPPAEATVAAALGRARDAAARPTPRALGLDVPEAVEAVLARALAVRPMERYQDARRFWAALQASLGASTALHAPPSTSAPLSKATIPPSSTAASPPSLSSSAMPSPSSPSSTASASPPAQRAARSPRVVAIAAAALVLLAAVAAAIVRCA